jgi:cell wall-associated NlpC family hydrolase
MLSSSEREAIVAFVQTFPPTPHAQMDCSHFVWEAIKIVRPNFPYVIAEDFPQVSTETNDPQPGDLIHFPDPGHIAVLLLDGDNWFVGSQTSTGVAVVSIRSAYWARRPHRNLQIA